MPSLDRPLAAEALHFHLGREHAEFIDPTLLARAGRSARTLIKAGPLRVTLVALGAGGHLAPHHADGPLTVHVLSGEIRFRTGEREWNLATGDLLSLASGVEHQVDSGNGGVFLLTVAACAA